MNGVLGALKLETPTAFMIIRDSVAEDASEHDPVRKVLGVMVKQGFATIEGEGDTATYKLTSSGQDLLNQIRGA